MAYSKTEKTVFNLAEPVAKENGCFIYDVEFVKEGGVYFLRVFIDKEGGVDLDMCERVSRQLNDKLDETDPIPQNYYLEVSSPGVERKLKTSEHFNRYIGSAVDIGLYKAINGSKNLCGVLKSYDGNNIVISTDGDDMEVSLKSATQVKLHFDF